MKDCLKLVAKEDKEPDIETVGLSSYSTLSDRSADIYSALKHLTEEGTAARRVITSTPKEDGFTAWWRLNTTFTQALAARQGAVMSLFTNTHSKPGKTSRDSIKTDRSGQRCEKVVRSHGRRRTRSNAENSICRDPGPHDQAAPDYVPRKRDQT